MKEPLEPPSPSIKKAVALKYTPGESEAPIVVAKGSGRIADSILEKAKEHGVPVQEDAALVEVLSKLDLDEQIPAELYQLVAEVLTYIYQMDRLASRDDW
ncbi:EscU/YscU/HrcU family type III secretion system export apparatus switch protein [Paenibacillus sp. SEL3]|jgi:flagellar biosynthesis protein|uniref:EscU/YscU/HrcU family type III secretion system export apparatus switch protein n=2 Tax=Paenibacillus TaxID=44249 RepID=A0A074L7M2_PAEPO|nr:MULTISPECIES: EscU/YscU/HrcU family type III secretion system export apparatus switch protein [Paenibacillus]MCF2718596.1 EscU/YscU/HrcU family type III secretion system export apparatus switch protein [Paenibacillus sp. UKAQ_18]AHC19565.1 FhlB domain-containing protein [Paenibacillus polymyxa CR1]ALA41820.1 FhlB domain-containing protein [Paenibacillus peoriae]AOK92345.1 FhlB domain-containing protein [Paenibacillus polymyxa]APB71493.1 FhlB domain-containing protein [Paenibacillus polymyxa